MDNKNGKNDTNLDSSNNIYNNGYYKGVYL